MANVVKDLPSLPVIQEPSSSTEQPAKPTGLFKRLTTKLRKPSESWGGEQSHTGDGVPRHRRRRTSPSGGRTHTAPVLENAWTSPELRTAALRERGLLPAQAQPFRDAHGYHLPLSEQEAQLDNRIAVTAGATGPANAERGSEAGKIAEQWMKKNLGEAYHAPSSSQEPDSEETVIRDELAKAPMSSPIPVPQRKESNAASRPAFLEREPQATKLLDAMKSYRPPARSATGNHHKQYTNGSDSSSDSD